MYYTRITPCTVCSPHINLVMPYPSIRVYFGYDFLLYSLYICIYMCVQPSEFTCMQLDPDPHFSFFPSLGGEYFADPFGFESETLPESSAL
jgi:hypothetical protein